ncbi:glycosyltransferase family 4 protein [Pseudohongiella sp. SYSU M77423]|uniref:glycosyltransferase family 4 protein n=1 Tax=Pseudohongiella sp. SYSU M77423 TaxID=3042312 RepID=UPI00248031CD|nr:glycosyltransferase family 4 protein [Pseudohongiella sp. SYSU M77423]MDH7944308.1 glycosyltransferase family 4 protein [Pseudohongiella sp. SYSU M77423]
MSTLPLYFVFPGDLGTPTGGYHYDRRLISELRTLGKQVIPIALSDRFPTPDKDALVDAEQKLSAIPDGAQVMIDGLAMGVMDQIVSRHARRLSLIALCHHPLSLEAGLSAAQQDALHHSEKRSLHCARATVVTSPHTAEILRNQFDLDTNSILVACPGTDRSEFAPCTGNPPRLLTVASLTRRKAHDVLIESLGVLKDLPWQARFVGGDHFDREWAQQLKAQVNQEQLARRIDFVGSVENLQPEYQQADLFVLPSRFEGYGMVFAEALAAGLPVIAARAGAVPDVVPASAGILVPADDAEALAAALREVLTDSSRRQALQRGARQAALALPGWRDSAMLVLNLTEELANRSDY